MLMMHPDETLFPKNYNCSVSALNIQLGVVKQCGFTEKG